MPAPAPTSPASDKRRSRGEARRRQILAGALRVIAQRGIGAATHRAIALEAGVPTSVTTYHFASIDALLEAALRLFVDEEIERVRAATATLGELGPAVDRASMADAVVRAVTADLGSQLAQFELYLEAVRRPSLAEAARACMEAYVELACRVLEHLGAQRPREGARTLLAVMDGLAVQRLVHPGEDFERAVAAPALLAVVEAYAPEQAG